MKISNHFRFQVIRRYAILFYIFTSFFTNITSAVETLTPFRLHRYKREILFRPLFVYKHRQQQYRQRWRNIQEFYKQHHVSGQQNWENYPAKQINNEFYESLPIGQISYGYQQYHQRQQYSARN